MFSMIGIQDSTTNNFSSLIRSGDKYIIPKFQRDYSWEVEQWDDLWQDIENMLLESRDHYMGYLVLQTTGKKECYIIDGQQRFTTITIIILTIIKAIQRLVDIGVEVEENKQRINTLMSTYIGNIDPITLEYDNILILNRNNDRYYKENIVKLQDMRIRNTSYTEKLMRKCFEWYEKKILNKYKTGREYAEFITTIVDNLYFTIIKVSDEMNAFRVFETLNARGVQLSSADLLKNYLFALVDDKHYPDRIGILEEKWSSLTNNIHAEKLPDFIRYYWNSKNKTVRANDLFKAIRDKIKTDMEVFALVSDMINYSDIYMALLNPNDELWNGDKDIVDNIELLKRFNLKQPYSLLMTAYKSLDKKGFIKMLQDIIVVSFRYSIICGKNPNEVERVYNKIAIQVSATKTYQTDQMREIYVDDVEFIPAFNMKQFPANTRNNQIAKYILGKIERFKGGTRDVIFTTETDTLEHILPQNPGVEWGDDNYNFDSLIYRLGNLCLLERQYNKDIENKAYVDKMSIYKKSAFLTTRMIENDYPQWGADSITQRQQKMGECAKGIWRLV